MSVTIMLPPSTSQAAFDRGSVLADPVTPTGLAISSGDGQLSLNWDFQFNKLGWELYRSTSSPVTTSDTKIELSENKSQYVDTSVSNGTTYYYAIRVKDSAGWSALSSEAVSTPMSWDNATSVLHSTGEYWTSSSTDTDFDLSAESFSISVWFTTGSGGRAIISNWNGSDEGWYLSRDTGEIQFRANRAGPGSLWMQTNSVGSGTWYHVVVTWDHSTQTGKIYRDGADETTYTFSTTSFDGSPDYSANTLQFGNNPAFNTINGYLHQCTIWNAALSSDQVSALYNSGTAVNPVAQTFASNLQHAWLFGDTPGDDETEVADAIGTAELTGVNVDSGDFVAVTP